MEIEELETALSEAEKSVAGLAIKEQASHLHAILGRVAQEKGYYLKLRK